MSIFLLQYHGEEVAVKKMRKGGESGFNISGGGLCITDGKFEGGSYFWTSDNFMVKVGSLQEVETNSGWEIKYCVKIWAINEAENYGYSVRCVKDAE
ncbi:hypothetical protein BVY01_02585 [bacterium I07]|nr:hypothetical protein BVY01_02585 [bacterium I07]